MDSIKEKAKIVKYKSTWPDYLVQERQTQCGFDLEGPQCHFKVKQVRKYSKPSNLSKEMKQFKKKRSHLHFTGSFKHADYL